jgi:hypothetical protein
MLSVVNQTLAVCQFVFNFLAKAASFFSQPTNLPDFGPTFALKLPL